MGIVTNESIQSSDGIWLGLVSYPKVGKTRLAATAKAPFYIDGDKGMRSAIDILQGKPEPWGYTFNEVWDEKKRDKPSAWMKIGAILDIFVQGVPNADLGIDPGKYDTIVLDTMTTISTFGLNFARWEYEYKLRNKDLDKKNAFYPYMALGREGTRLCDKLMALSVPPHSKNIIANFHIEDTNITEAGTVLRQAPFCQGKMIGKYMFPLFDAMWGLERVNGNLIAHTEEFEKIDSLGSRIQFPAQFISPNLETIFADIKSGEYLQKEKVK